MIDTADALETKGAGMREDRIGFVKTLDFDLDSRLVAQREVIEGN